MTGPITRLNALPFIAMLRRRFGGRLHRTGYFLYGLLFTLGGALVALLFAFVLSRVIGVSLEDAFENSVVRAVDVGLTLVVSCLRQYLVVRRLHDFNRSGWWSLVFLLPVPWPPFHYALIALSLVILFVLGTRGPNRYGSRPGGSVPRIEGIPTLDGKPPF